MKNDVHNPVSLNVLDARYVLKAGDVMTGDLTINSASTTALVVEDSGTIDNLFVVDTVNSHIDLGDGITTSSWSGSAQLRMGGVGVVADAQITLGRPAAGTIDWKSIDIVTNQNANVINITKTAGSAGAFVGGTAASAKMDLFSVTNTDTSQTAYNLSQAVVNATITISKDMIHYAGMDLTLNQDRTSKGTNNNLVYGFRATLTSDIADAGDFGYGFEITCGTANIVGGRIITHASQVSDSFRIEDSSNNGLFIVDASGSVGIGAATPGELLELEGADDIFALINSTGANSDAGIKLQNDAVTWQIRAWGGSADRFVIADGPNAADIVFVAETGGDIGIGGQTNPQANLHIGLGTKATIGSTPDVDFQLSSTTSGHEVANTYFINEGTRNIRAKVSLDDTTNAFTYAVQADTTFPDIIWNRQSSAVLKINTSAASAALSHIDIPNDNQMLQFGATVTDLQISSDGANGVFDTTGVIKLNATTEIRSSFFVFAEPTFQVAQFSLSNSGGGFGLGHFLLANSAQASQEVTPTSGNQIVYTQFWSGLRDYDHASQSDFTAFFQGTIDPNISNNHFGFITHDRADFIISTGDATGVGTSPNTIRNAIILRGTGGTVTENGRIIQTNRLTANTTLDETYHNVYGDTDGGAFAVTLSAGENGRYYRIINTGSSGNALTITPDGSELLLGDNSDFTLLDGDVLIIAYETTEGWW